MIKEYLLKSECLPVSGQRYFKIYRYFKNYVLKFDINEKDVVSDNIYDNKERIEWHAKKLDNLFEILYKGLDMLEESVNEFDKTIDD